jgi:hypothetical protein
MTAKQVRGERPFRFEWPRGKNEMVVRFSFVESARTAKGANQTIDVTTS